MNRNDPKTKQINCVLLKKQVDWIDKQAKLLGLDRTKVLRMILDGLMRTEAASKKDETLFNVYTNHLEMILEESTKKKKAKRK